MKKIKLVVIALAVVFLASGVAYAQSEGEHTPADKEQKSRIFKELNLTAEQQQKLKENRKAQREGMMNLRASIKEKYVKLQNDLKDPAVTKVAIEPLVNEIKSLQGQLVDNRIAGIFAVKEILTPEQFTKFQQAAGKRMEHQKSRMQEKHGKRKCFHPDRA